MHIRIEIECNSIILTYIFPILFSSEIDQSNGKNNEEEAKDSLSALTSMFPKPQFEKTKKRGR